MLYCEIQLEGNVRFYEMTDARLLLWVAIYAEAAAITKPNTVQDAHEYLRARCHALEMFDCLEHAEGWAEDYAGFRAGEVRAALTRYQLRREQFRLAA